MIAQRVATSLVRGISAADRDALKRRETSNSEAYDYYLRARGQWAMRTPEAIRTAIQLYNRAIALDTTFALAYAGLADAYNVTRSGLRATERYPLAKVAAERALALDAGLSEAHTARAFQRYKFEWNWPEADAGFKRAIALDPAYALAHHWYAECLFHQGRYPEAITEYQKALALDPFSTALLYDLGRALLRAGDVPRARAIIEQGLALNHNNAPLLVGLSEVLAAEGKQAEGVEMLWRSMLMAGRNAAEVEASRAAYQRGGMAGAAHGGDSKALAAGRPRGAAGRDAVGAGVWTRAERRAHAVLAGARDRGPRGRGDSAAQPARLRFYA